MKLIERASQMSMTQNGGIDMIQRIGLDSKQTLASGIERWLYGRKKNSVKSASFERLLTSYRLLIDYPISNMRILDLTSEDVQRFINTLVSQSYSLSTIKKEYNLISSFVRFAMGEGLIIKPIYMNAILPVEESIQKQKRNVNAYNMAEQKKLISTCESHMNIGAKVTILLLETGMRIGELLALQWSDVLWSRKAIYIHRTLIRPASRKRGVVQEGAKSKTSNRTIPLSARALKVLYEMYSDCGEGDGFVLSATGNSNLSIAYNPLAKHIKALCEVAGVKWRGFHVFRHTFATNCYYKGCDIKLLSKLLGHASVTITYNTYIHLYGDALEELRSVVE